MSRAIFLTLYIPVALFLSSGFASMWTLTIMALTLAQKGAAALFSPVFLISIFAPIALIVLAHARGKKINNRKLIWFPITAFLLTLVPLIMGLLVKALTGSGMDRAGTASVYVSMIVATTSTVGPLILHTVCCVLGGKKDSQDKREDVSVRIDRGYENVTPKASLHSDSPGR